MITFLAARMGGDSHCLGRYFGQREQRLLQITWGRNVSAESIPLAAPVSTASSFPLPLKVRIGQRSKFFSTPFLSLLIFSHSPWQLQGGGGRADAAAACMYVWSSVVFLCESGAVCIYHRLPPGKTFSSIDVV